MLIESLMSCTYGGAGDTNATTDTAGTPRDIGGATGNRANVLASKGAAGDVTMGIIVGTGNAANTGATKSIQTIISHGVAPGNLSYGGNGYTSPSGTTPLSFTITRTFTNNSGGDITITEAALYLSSIDTASAQRFFCILRDVNAGGLATVLNGANTTATYTLSYNIA